MRRKFEFDLSSGTASVYETVCLRRMAKKEDVHEACVRAGFVLNLDACC